MFCGNHNAGPVQMYCCRARVGNTNAQVTADKCRFNRKNFGVQAGPLVSLPHPRQLLKRGPLSKRGRSSSFHERYAVRRFCPCDGTTHNTICFLILTQRCP